MDGWMDEDNNTLKEIQRDGWRGAALLSIQEQQHLLKRENDVLSFLDKGVARLLLQLIFFWQRLPEREVRLGRRVREKSRKLCQVVSA
jgi:hypothetical protein